MVEGTHWALAAVLACTVVACKNESTAAGDKVPGHAESAAVPPVEVRSAHPFVEHWFAKNRTSFYGLYIAGDKVGWATMWTRPATLVEVGDYVAGVTVNMSVVADGVRSSASLEDVRYYGGGPNHVLIGVDTSESSIDGAFVVHYRRMGDEFEVTEKRAGQPDHHRRIEAVAETLMDAFAAEMLAVNASKVGTISTVTVFDAEDELGHAAEIRVLVVSLETMGIEGHRYVVEEREVAGATAERNELDGTGQMLRMTLGEIEMRLEDEKVAKSDVVGLDAAGPGLAVDKSLGPAENIETLEVLVGGGFRPPASPRQRVRARGDGFALSLSTGAAEPVTDDQRKRLLGRTAVFDFDSPAVAARARELSRGSKSKRETVGNIVRWVYRHLDKNLATNLSTASQILEASVGDCSEHAILTVALARAAGIPAREVSGLMYLGDDVGRFGYHAWVEVEVDGRWQPVDPSFDQVRADATHLKLGDTDDADWVEAIGGLSLEITGIVPRAPGP